MHVCVDGGGESAHAGSSLQEVDGWSSERGIVAAVGKSLQSNLIKAAVCVLAPSLHYVLLAAVAYSLKSSGSRECVALFTLSSLCLYQLWSRR